MNDLLYAAAGRKVAFQSNPFFIYQKITTLGLIQMRHAGLSQNHRQAR